MDYFQTSERYRKQELRSLFNTVLRVAFAGVCIWIGWFWGYNQHTTLTASATDQVIRLGLANERLEQQLAMLSAEMDRERLLRRKAELLLGDPEDTAQGRLSGRVAGYLAKGIGEDEIDLALHALAEPARCRPLEERNVAVATGFFAGRESMARMINGDMRVFVEGVAGRQATRDKPWFDESQPVSIRVTYLNGEKTATGTLPFETNVIADSWLIRIRVEDAELQGYANVAVAKCSYE